jgi:AraC-like DNA-binding protein
MHALRLYADFNQSAKTQVRTLSLNGRKIAGHCRYNSRSTDAFLLPDATFSYVLQGEKQIFTHGKSFHLQAGSLLYLPPRSMLFSEIPEQSARFESVNITVPAALLKSFQEDLRIRGSLESGQSIYLQTPEIDRCFEALHADFGTLRGNEDLISRLYALLDSCAQEIYRPGNEENVQSGNPLLQAVVAKSLYAPMTLPEIAASCHVSLSTFKRHFAAEFGTSPKPWLLSRRLETAYFYLQLGQLPVSEISLLTGFEHFAHFSWAFKKHFGCTPSQVRKQLLS